MNYIYTDLHIHTSENANKINKDYDVSLLKKQIETASKGRGYLISLTDHNTINLPAYLKMFDLGMCFLVGVEVHIKNYEQCDAYHCHLFFNLEIENKVSLQKYITDLNSILDKLYPDKIPQKSSNDIPDISKIINSFDKYDFLVLPHGGQSHATFNTSIPKGAIFDTTLERSLYYNFFDGFTSRTTSGVETTENYFKTLGINSFINLITCSDNYNISKYPQAKASDKPFVPTWINATPNFLGLKLALTEKSRLFYGEAPNESSQDFINKVELHNDKIDIDVNLEQGLNVVIGNSSSGKTLFVDSVFKKISNENSDDYSKFGVANISVNNPSNIKPHYFPQNYILNIVGKNDEKENSLDSNEYLKSIFPLDKDASEKIASNLKSLLNSINLMVGSVKSIKATQDKILALPSFFRLFYLGASVLNPLEPFRIGVNEKKMTELSTTKREEIEKAISLLEKSNKEIAFLEDYSVDIKNIRDKLSSAYEEIDFSKKVNEEIEREYGAINNILKQKSEAQIKIKEDKESFFNCVKELFDSYQNFYSALSSIKSLSINIKTKEIQSSGHTLYIENNFIINNDILEESINDFLKTGCSIKLDSIKPSDLFEDKFSKKNPKIIDIDDFGRKLYAKISENNKTKYKIKYNNNQDFDTLSPGLKASVILDIILGYEKDHAPLIIDQPEDNLATSYINYGLIKAIKKCKSNRQIIIISHNATIPLLGDAQNIVYCKNDGQKIIIKSYHLEDKIGKETITDLIANITDGGKASIKKRFKKYNMKSFREEQKDEN